MCSFESPYCKRIASHGNCLSRFHRDAADKFPDVTLLDLFSDYKKCVVPIWAYRMRIWEFMILHDSLWPFCHSSVPLKKSELIAGAALGIKNKFFSTLLLRVLKSRDIISTKQENLGSL